MRLKTSYGQILNISIPVMLGSAAQNVVALSDSVFLFHVGEADFAAIGFIGVFYLIIAAIGYGFSKGGQIIIARRFGEKNYEEIGRTFYALCYFELFIALILFGFMQLMVPYLFSFFVDSPLILEKSMAYLNPRSYGIFFSYVGVVILAFYTGIANTKFILIDTIILALTNIVLNYAFIFGKWGFPEMGIMGAGLASTLAEVVAFVVIVIYMLVHKDIRKFKLNVLPTIPFHLVKQIYNVSFPIVAQAVLSIGSWFIFFSLIENLGEREMAIANLVRMVYLMLSIPAWGYSAGINTLVSNFIGANKRQAVYPIIIKTAKLSVFTTMIFALPIALFPNFFLYPLLGGQDPGLILASQPILYILLVILALFSFGLILFNGLVGTGATYIGLKLQFFATVLYLAYIYIEIYLTNGGLLWAWGTEILYWVFLILVSLKFLRTKNWHYVSV